MNVIFDSNVWIAFLNKEDSQHEKAVQIFQENEDKVVIPEYVVLEVSSVLQIRANQSLANKFLQKISQSTNVEILLSTQELFLATNVLFQSQKKGKLAFTDYALLALSEKINVITFDVNLQKAIK